MIDLLLRIGFVRNKLLFHLKHKYFHEFEHSIPLESGYWAHLLEKDSYDSFSEIFIKQEYLEFIPDEPISRILDIGAHYGYFSLWLQSRHPEIELSSLMIEPSPSCARSLQNLAKQEILDGRFFFPSKKHWPSCFRKQSFLRSISHGRFEIFLISIRKAIQVQNLSEADLVENSEAPYDLIKCDIEGSEWAFLNNFQNLIKESKYLLLEWHSWHEGGGGFSQIEKSMHSLDFSMVRSSEPAPAIARGGSGIDSL